MNIIKPNNDNRNYKYYILKNNIKCILINDVTLDKSYVVTSVNAGSYANKKYYEGIAHLLEHMCFITSKKYQEKDYLISKIGEAGGSTNAFTAELNTIYYFDIFTKNLESILEIYVDFLTNAELKKEYILNELKNVDSEHKKNINNDGWKLLNLKRLLANSESNYNGFYTGSSETLNKPDIYDKMLDFYKKYYNPNNISICIASNKSIDELINITEKYFGSILKSNIENDLTLIKPIYSINKGKTYHMQSNSDIKILEYIFEIADYNINSKIYNLLSNILNSPEENLPIDYLKSLGYINSLNSSVDLAGIFIIKLILTQKGIEHINDINNILKYFINKILLLDWNKINEYNKKKYNFLFNNLNKMDTLDLCTDLLMNLLYYEPSKIYYCNYEYNNLTNNDIVNLNKYINLDDAIKIIVTKNFRYSNYLVDKYYNTKYKEINIFTNPIKIMSMDTNYNSINKYSNIKPKYIENINYKIPEIINKNIWYGGISDFNEPIIYCNIIFSNINYFCSPKNFLLTNICVKILNYHINKELYKAFEYNYVASINVCSEYNSIELRLYLYNDLNYHEQFINDTLNLIINNINITDDLIKSKISLFKDSINSITTVNPWEYCEYIFNNAYINLYMYDILLVELNKININEIRTFLKSIIENAGSYVIIYGNINKNNLPNLNNINTNLNICKFPKIEIKKNLIINHPNKKEISNCIKISYFTGKFKPIINLHLIFIKLITHNIFFEDLRTTQQVGYLVSMGVSKISNEYYIYQQIQSELTCDKIIDSINKFNTIKLLEEIKKIDLYKWKETVTNYLNKKENNNNEIFNKYYNEIINRTYLFNRNELMLKYIDMVTIDTLICFIIKFILNNKKKSILQINSQN